MWNLPFSKVSLKTMAMIFYIKNLSTNFMFPVYSVVSITVMYSTVSLKTTASEEDDNTLFDDFSFHFKIFHNFYMKNSLFL
jgi:hypothetical protein